MIQIDMEMPTSCRACNLETNELVCAVTGFETLSARDIGRDPDCPLHSLDEEVLDDDKICVGDEVLNTVNEWKYVVTRIEPDGDLSVLHCPSGRATGVSKSDVKRTGRHFDEVETLLKKMRGEDDG